MGRDPVRHRVYMSENDPLVTDNPQHRAPAAAAEPAWGASELLRSFGITSVHLAQVSALGRYPQVDPEQLVDAFYRWLDEQPWKQRFFGAGVPAQVRTAQVWYWREFLNGVVDESYIESRRSVGATHARIELPPKAFSTSMAFCQRWLTDAARALDMQQADLLDSVAAVSLLCQLDASLIMEAYSLHSERRRRQATDKVHAINREVTRVVVAASRGNFQERYQPLGEDDARLAEAVNQMVDGFATTIRQAKAIAAGDYSSDVAPRSSNDELGRVLAEMTQRLREATVRTERDQWLRQGQAEVFECMRGELSVEDLARNVIAYTAKRIDAPMASVYVPGDDEELSLAAAYGCAKTDLRPHVKLGEGILGEVAQDHKPIFALDISASPLVGFHGLGELTLSRVTLLPVVAYGALQGVLQYATPTAPTPRQWEFLALIAENVAFGLASAAATVRMKDLLACTQSQSDELQAQAEELRASNEELEERSEALTQARAELQTKNQNLERHQAAIEAARAELEERAAELALASKYKSEFLANMSHELRTPLNSILILARSLRDNVDGNLTEQQLEAARIIHAGGEDLLRLINDILDLSKVEAGKLSIELGSIPVNDLLKSLQQQFQPVAAEHGLQLVTECDPGAPAALESDRLRLEQILKNLLSNAFKFTEQGAVYLRIAPVAGDERIRVDALRTVPAVAISVTDTGIGIEQDKQRAIFEAFQQADGSTSRTHGGTGLGLTISRELSRLLGAEIHLQSTPGQGSTFTVFVPVTHPGTEQESGVPVGGAEPHAPLSASGPVPRGLVASALQDQLAPGGSAPVLLIVEDDPTFAQLLLQLVRERGYQGTLAGTGKEALLLAERMRPDGIILDIGLPDLDGIQVLEQLKYNLNTRHIPVHVTSGHERQKDALSMGAIAYLHKPVQKPQLTSMIERFEALWSTRVRHILLIEDDARSRKAIEQLIGDDEIRIVSVGSGSEGLQALRQQAFDCMIVDLGLPDMSGADFLKQLQDDHPPVIVHTGQELSDAQLAELQTYKSRVVLKSASSPERLLDEVSLFLHQVEGQLPEFQRAVIKKLHDPEAMLQGRKVLVVDDDMRNVFAMTDLLQRHGMDVDKAKNGQIALDRLDADPNIDLVVMDIMMPVMDGHEAMRRIRAQPRFSRLPIIALTARILPEDRQACLESGASDYITKPMDPENLMALIRVLLFDAATLRPPRNGESGSRHAS